MSYASLGEIKKQARKNGMFFKKRDSRKSRENPTDLYPTNSTYSIGSDSKNRPVGWVADRRYPLDKTYNLNPSKSSVSMIIIFVCPEIFRLIFMTRLTTATKLQSNMNILNEIISCLSCIFQFTTQFIVLPEFRQQFYCFMKCQKPPSYQREVLLISNVSVVPGLT